MKRKKGETRFDYHERVQRTSKLVRHVKSERYYATYD